MLNVKTWPEYGLSLEQITGGIKVSQEIYGEKRGYFARGQKLCQRTIDIFDISIECGFTYAIQSGHPRQQNLFPNSNGVVYLSLGPKYIEPWVITIDDQLDKIDKQNLILINKRYEKILIDGDIPIHEQWRSSKHLVIDYQYVSRCLSVISGTMQNRK